MSEVLNVMIPQELENMKLPSPELKQYYEDLENRTIYVDFDIDVDLLTVTKYILQWNREDRNIDVKDRKPILLLVFSYGGELDSMLSFIDIIHLSKTPIYTYDMGICASAAALIFMCGHKRFILPKAQIMIHGGSAGLQGTSTQVLDAAENYKKMLDIMKDIIFSHSKIDTKLFNKKSKNEWYISAEESITLGLSDVIVDDIEMLF
ncbi:MAG: ATP-dependent Clp protease proteolytic subunit [Bacilli bacterium]